MRAFIPRKLDDVVDFERDLDRVREGIDTDLVNRLFLSLTTAIQPVYCKTRIVRMPFISRISRPWHVRENNGSRICIFYRQSISLASKNTKIKGAKIIQWT